jgi:hypothetical protein
VYFNLPSTRRTGESIVPARNYVAELDVFSDTSSKSREHITRVSNGTNRFRNEGETIPTAKLVRSNRTS